MNEELIAFANSISFPHNLSLDGEIHRFDRGGTKNGWFIGWMINASNGDPFIFCIFADWKTGERHEFKPKRTMTKEDRKSLKQIQSEAAKKFEIEKKEKQKEAASIAIADAAKMSKAIEKSKYVHTKKIVYSDGIGLINEDLQIPMVDENGEIVGIQKILPDGRKFFTPGQKTIGAFHVIGNLSDPTLILVEGYATGSSVRQATKNTVIVCFNCNNILPVAKIIRKKNPLSSIIIAGDDDRWTDGNPGRTKAIEAAKVVGGTTVFPEFINPEKGKTDFNDLHCIEGLPKVKEQIELISSEPDDYGYLPLGYEESTYFFYCLSSKSVVKTSSFSDKSLMELMPLSHWEMCYPSHTGGVKWNQAVSDLIEKSKIVGSFDPLRVRGSGVWRDNGRTIINTGDRLTVDGKPTAMGGLKSWYIYVKTKHKIPQVHSNPLTLKECGILDDACRFLTWKEKHSGVYLAGWIALSRIAGALPIRPHVWLTGGSGTGKSTVMDRLIRPALGAESARLYAQGGSTEAGLRQTIRADSMPIIFDEFETTNDSTKARTLSIIELLRQAWSHTHGHVVKGSAGGSASHYTLNFAALVSSIRIVLDNDADKSRFSILELAPHGSDKTQWKEVSKHLQLITEEYGERLFSRMTHMIPTILSSYKTLAEAISEVSSQRSGQQYGMLLAAYYALISDEPITEYVARNMVRDADICGENKQIPETDESETLAHILTTKLSAQDYEGNRKELTIGSVIHDMVENGLACETEIAELRKYGILLEPDQLYVANNHSTLSKAVFRQTKWTVNWGRSLERLPGAKKDRKRFDGPNPISCVSIPFDTIIPK